MNLSYYDIIKYIMIKWMYYDMIKKFIMIILNYHDKTNLSR